MELKVLSFAMCLPAQFVEIILDGIESYFKNRELRYIAIKTIILDGIESQIHRPLWGFPILPR